MQPTQRIQNLCRRHGVSRAFGEKLLPLLERAERLEPEPRQRILDLVTRSFEEEGRRQRAQKLERARIRALSPEDRKVLRTVATLVHGWTPPSWLVGWGKRQAE